MAELAGLERSGASKTRRSPFNPASPGYYNMIYHQHRCIFIHIPKTAGKSMSNALGLGWPGHKDISQYAVELNRDVLKTYFKFSIVRNPWERLVSEYNYQRKKKRPKKDKLYVFDERGSKREFADWVRIAFADPRRYHGSDWAGDVSPQIHRWSPQLDWISIDDRVAVDFVARLENINQDFQEIRKRIGLPLATFPHSNGKWHWHYSHYYDPATRDMVAQYYARDIKAFNYRYEERSTFDYLREQICSRLIAGIRKRRSNMSKAPSSLKL
jgi:hypothetical protein